jgi:CRP-like cAMP-binding protein
MPNDPKTDALKHQSSLSTEAARNLSTTTKSAPQMQGITSRWLLKVLPWIQVSGGVYRVNRRLSYSLGDGRVSVSQTGATAQVIPQELCEIPLLRGFDNVDVLSALSSRFVQLELKPGDVITEAGKPAEFMYLIAHGKANKLAAGKYGEEAIVSVIAGGEYFGDKRLIEPNAVWDFTIKAITTCTLLALPRKAFEDLLTQSESLRTHVERFKLNLKQPRDNSGEASIALSAGHSGETELPSTFVDYELHPREYELSIAQTVLQVHSRVADLYNQPMNQIEQQLRLTVEALREQQEHEMINNRSFGLLHNADFRQRINTKSGPPTPDDLDELLSIVWKEPSVFLAHPRTIAAFGQECSKRGLYPHGIEIAGHSVPAWRGVPILPCNKIPISETRTSSIMLMRTGEKNQGVIGLHQTGIPDEIEPSLSARFMGINDKALISYLVTAYFSAAVLVPDALGVLEDVQIGR